MASDTGHKGTLLETVRASLSHAARYNPGDVVAPAAVLWTDADGQWRPVVEQLRGLMPELLTLGEYDPETRTGPTSGCDASSSRRCGRKSSPNSLGRRALYR